MLRKTFCLICATKLRILTMFVVTLTTLCSFAADAKSQERGFQPGASYALSDIEAINASNGNMIVQIPLASLPPGRGGVPGPQLKLVYNSKLYATHTETLTQQNGQPFTQIFLNPDEEGGWRYSTNYGYHLKLISRLNVEGSYPCICDANLQKNAYIWKLMVIFPDGGEHEFRPFGYTDLYSDGYFDIDPHGTQSGTTCSTIGPGTVSCGFSQWQATTNGMTYYSTNGTFMRLFVPFTSGSWPTNWNTSWTLSFPDGKRLISSSSGQTMLDRNDNVVPVGLQDTLGRQIDIQPGNGPDEDRIVVTGANQQQLEWIVKWKTIYVSRPYTATAPSGGRERGNSTTQVLTSEDRVVDRITLPAQAGGLTYVFGYSASDTDVYPDYSPGWGELNAITLPTGAQVNYTWAFDGPTSGRPPNWDWILNNHPARKDLTYLLQYDGTSTPTTETWTYSGLFRTSSTFSVTAPDGGVTTTYSFAPSTNSPFVGYAFKTEHPDGSVTERVWKQNRPQGVPVIPKAVNPYVDREFHSIRNAAGVLTKTAITQYSYDKNGNPTEVKQYDWVDYASLQRDADGNFVIPSQAVLIKRTTSTYYNATPDATDSTTPSGNVYYTTSAPRLLNAAKAVEISGGSAALARTEFFYDNPLTTGNLTEKKTWDSAKGAYSNPLGSTNSASTTTQYNSFGSPILTTDARGFQTRLTYGPIAGVSDLYPTEVETAFGTPRERTEARQYDFNTALVTSVRDVDNNVSTMTTYDDLGRPILVRAAADLPEETQTATQYFDSERRVVVRADQVSTGDGKLVSIQHYDQLGRVRLTRKLEEFSTAALADETIGIKVQTRYRISNPCQPTNALQCLQDNSAVLGSYVLTSNPYRAANSQEASSEPTMGWTRSRSDKTGRLVEAQTFAGAGLPAPWAGNGATTGTVTTSYDGIFTTVTDQAGKVRRTQVDALERLIRVDEPSDQNNTLGPVDAPTQATSYEYDALGNLKFINQGTQTRTFNYTSLSRLKDATNPESGTISYQYDENGNLKVKTDPRFLPNSSTHITVLYEYDELNRITSRTYNDGTPNVTYAYDAVLYSKGRLTSVSSSVSSYSYTSFDPLGHVLAARQFTNGQDHVMSYTYDKAGNMKSQTYPSGRIVTTDYDSAGRVAGVRHDASTHYAGAAADDANRIQYSTHGAIVHMRLGNGLWEHSNFNSRQQPTQIGLGTSQGGTDRLKLNYDYGTTDNNGNLRSQTITVPTNGTATGFTSTQIYEYDAANRLSSASENSGTSWTQNFTYDRYGNRNFAAGTTLPAPLTASNNPEIVLGTNRINTSVSGQTNVTYDNAGNLTRDVIGHASGYDAENKMTTYDGGSSVGGASYSYDGDGKRVKKVVSGSPEVTTVFVYNIVGQLIAEYSSAPPGTGGTSYLTSDMLGSPRIVTGSSQEVKTRHDYLPYGEEISANYGGRTTTQRYVSGSLKQKFTGKERDQETGLDYFGARYYSSMIGRFTSIDPITIKKTRLLDPQRINLYAYVRGNPLKFLDPTGEDITIVVTNIVTGTSTVNCARNGQGNRVPETANTYRMTVTNQSGTTREFNVTRDTNYNGPVSQTRGQYGTNSEAPPGNYRGHIRNEPGHRLGWRVELYDPNVTQVGNNDTINAPDGTQRTNIQIHRGPGCSQGCIVLNEGVANFQQAVTDMQAEDQRNNFGTDIYVNLEDRNNPNTGDLPNGDRIDVPRNDAGTILVVPVPAPPRPPQQPPPPQPRPTPNE